MNPRIPSAVAVFAAAFSLHAQPAPSGETRFQRFTRQSREAEAKGLAEPFRGITAQGAVEPGLFPVRSTGVSTGPVRDAARAFLAALTPAQRAKTVFPVDDPEWRKWMNQHFYVRQGVSFQEMNEAQRAAAFGLMRAGLSAKGLDLARDIMRLNHTLGELNHNNFEEYGEWLYWITVMGEPSADRPWGWQVDGHHLIINYFVLGDQVVMSPVFVGSEPVTARDGLHRGVLRPGKDGNDNLTEAFRDNVVLDYAGVPATSLDAKQRAALLELIALHTGNLADGHARVKFEEVRAHLDRTHFAWIGGDRDDGVFYYRIHSPVVLIEFDHQRPANLRHLAADPRQPSREHIHVVVRTPNGNDYGKDLLRQHLATAGH